MKLRGLSFIVIPALLAWGALAAEDTAEKPAPKQDAPQVVFETTLGSFTIELFPDKAPKTVANFLAYVDDGFYDNTIFHRTIPGFVIQGGGFEKGMRQKPTRAPIENESKNRVKNTRGALSMARTGDPHSATSQFFVNLKHNISLDFRGYGFGYAVFAQVIEGIEVIDKIVEQPTHTVGHFENVPIEDVVVLEAKRTTGAKAAKAASASGPLRFMPGEHYVVLDKPVETRDSGKVEVVETFSYGCPPCYEFEGLMTEWQGQQLSDVDFWLFPAVWSEPMKVYAQAFYAARELGVLSKIHQPLFTAIVIQQQKISNEEELANFFSGFGVTKKDFSDAFNSSSVNDQVKQSEALTKTYNPAGAPEIIINGKYRVDRARAGGLPQMLEITDFLIAQERDLLAKQ